MAGSLGAITVDAIPVCLQNELTAAEHVVHVRQNLAECESGLVLIEFALENHEGRYQQRKAAAVGMRRR